MARMYARMLVIPEVVGPVDQDLAVEAAGAQQRRIENLRAIRRREEDDALRWIEAVHFDEQLIQGLLLLVVAPDLQSGPGARFPHRVELIDGFGVQGAACENGPAILFNATGAPITNAEASLPDVPCDSVILTGLQANATYEIHLGGLNVTNVKDAVLPGVSAGTERLLSRGCSLQ